MPQEASVPQASSIDPPMMQTDHAIQRAVITGVTGSGSSYLAEHIVQRHPEFRRSRLSREQADADAQQ